MTLLATCTAAAAGWSFTILGGRRGGERERERWEERERVREKE